MAVSIIKTDSRGAYRLVAEHDLYLDESKSKVLVVKEGEKVPKEAAFVLAGKGGTIPTRYAEMLKALDSKSDLVPAPAPEPEPAPLPSADSGLVAEVAPEVTQPSAVEPSPQLNEKLKPKAAKVKP